MQLPQDWNLPASIRARLGANTTGRERAMVAEGHLLLVLHQVPRWRDPDGRWASSGENRAFPRCRST